MKKIFLILFASMLAACAPLAPRASSQAFDLPQPALIISTSIPAGQVTPAPTWTYLIPATPTATSIPTTAPEKQVAMPKPLPTGPVCLQPIAPADGTTFLKRKPVRFTWYAKRDAQSYVLLLVHQDGFQDKLVVTGTELLLRLKPKPNDLTYQWMVAAYDAQNQLICNSPLRTFTLYSAPEAGAASTPSSSP